MKGKRKITKKTKEESYKIPILISICLSIFLCIFVMETYLPLLGWYFVLPEHTILTYFVEYWHHIIMLAILFLIYVVEVCFIFKIFSHE